jgi:tetratricopeptide (TPR) repeat protein
MFSRKSLITFIGGALGGICLSLILGIGLFYSHAGQTLQPNSTLITQSINIFQASTPTPASLQTNVLDEAESALDSGQPEKVRDLLYPTIENWISNDDRIRGYRLLGEAELAQGHAQLAVPYFEKLYFYEPSAENLFFLATIYDTGGDIRNALAKYEELSNWENLPEGIDIEFIHMRIYDISRALGTPVPTHTPLP